ncbi:14783_t:CDS:2 [Cetraspora pellucida]|uniref:14783_t:CDS:1 n=1 Tax=Cetraspora pellucida TaxID=1433469 RepID=A0A9N8YXB3_9GLOM|nr:14783_t:CDS:2 [Cetraspora pellucida]
MILNGYIPFLKNIKHFFIFCILVTTTTTSRYSIVNCEYDQSEQGLINDRRNFKSILRKRSIIKNRNVENDQLIQTRQVNDSFTNVTTNQIINNDENLVQSSFCGGLCILGIMVGIIIIIISIGFGLFFVLRKRKRQRVGGEKEIRGSKRMTPSSPTTTDDFLKPSSPPPFESRLNDEAEEFAQKHPPQEEIPPHEHVVYIQSLGGAKAWEWVPDEDLLSQQFVTITNEGSIVTFKKRIDSMVQTNYPFFIPQTEGDTIYEPPFEQPETMEKRIGYHSNDGKKFNDAPSGREYGPMWGEVGDTVGCAYNPDVGQVFFTKNGQFLGNAFANIRHIWFPTIGANGPCTIETNFGDNPDKEFRYENARGYGPGESGSPRSRTD